MAPAADLFATLMVDEAAALDAFEWMHNVANKTANVWSSTTAGACLNGAPRTEPL